MNFDSSFQTAGATAMPVKPQSRRIQISIRSLILLMTGVALVFGCIAAPELFVFACLILHFAIFIVMMTSALVAKGWFRCFAIGFFPLQLFAFALLLDGPGSAEAFLIVSLLAIPSACLSGTIAAATYSFLLRRNGMVIPPRILSKWLSNPKIQPPEPTTET